AIDAIRKSDGFLVPAFRTLAPANQQDSRLARIEGEKHTIWLATVLNAQFLHIRKARTFDRIHIGPSQYRSKHLEQIDLTANGNLLDRKSTRLNSSHSQISYAVFCL